MKRLEEEKFTNLDACIQVSEFGTRTNMRKKLDRAEFECLQNYGIAEQRVMLSIMKRLEEEKFTSMDASIQVSEFGTRTNMRKKPDRAEFECL